MYLFNVSHQRLAVLILGVASFFLGSLARAEDAEESARYRQVISQALAEYDLQHYLEARALFAQAHELSPSARTLRGLGAVSFELRRYSESVSFFEQALASDTKPLRGEMRATAERLLARARRFVARIEVTVEPEAARVRIDRAIPQEVPREPLLLDVGPHELEFRASGYIPERRSYTAIGGESETWRVVLRREPTSSASQPAEAVQSATTSPTARGSHAGKMVAAAMGVVGVTSFAAAGATMVKRRARGAEVVAVDVRSSLYSPRLEAWQNSRPKPYAFAAAGAAILAGGAIALMLSVDLHDTPWWPSALSAALGLGVAAVGTAYIARGERCDWDVAQRAQCVVPQEQRDIGALITMSAMPLLALPLTHLLRSLLASDGGTGAASIYPQFEPLRGVLTMNLAYRTP